MTIATKFTSPAFVCAIVSQPDDCLNDNFFLKSFVEGYLPAGILAGVLALVPVIARGLGHWEGLHLFSDIDHAQLRKVGRELLSGEFSVAAKS